MTTQEREILAEIGKLHLFVFRSRNIDTDDGIDLDILKEYREIISKYGRKEKLQTMSTQVASICRELMTELEKDMKQLNRHTVCTYSVGVNLSSIVSVTCMCGETTLYKVPLRLISDFVCPKERS